MLEFINDWIINSRTDSLSAIFRFFPIFASEYFYISIIALFCWMRPGSNISKSLGFLVPYSTLINCTLKNIFQITRPDLSLHLVQVYDPFGLPSGDVQVSTVFWTFLCMNLNKFWLNILAIFIILGVAIVN